MKRSLLVPMIVILAGFFKAQAAPLWPWQNASMGEGAPAWATTDIAAGQIWYVDINAPESAETGSHDQPFHRIAAALKVARPGDEIWLEPGVYHEQVRIRKPNITLRSSVLHQAKIEVPFNEKKIQQAIRIDFTAKGTRVIGLDISGGYYYAVSLHTKWKGGPHSGVSQVLLSQNLLHGSGRDLLKINPYVWQVLIERNQFYRSGQRDNSNAEAIDAVNASELWIQDNLIKGIATSGIYVKGGSHEVLIQRNLIRNVGLAGILAGFDTSPQFFNMTDNPNMYEARRVRIINNIVDGSQGAGIGAYSAEQVVVAHNTVLNSAIRYHAPIYFGLSFQDRELDAKRPPSKDISVYNNIFSSLRRDGTVLEVRYLEDDTLGGLSSLQGWPKANNNRYFSAFGPASFTDMRPHAKQRSSNLSEWMKWCACEADTQLIEVTLSYPNYMPQGADFQFTSKAESLAVDFYQNKRVSTTYVGAVIPN
ncbi:MULTISPECIES: right-handed parallel beta-helix repeat-containing protein [unclassified Agarivorans]|uniref:right-handed parallel beta-helix repeat-containing protein n=1 Tax=unclassified Agarivorans TaxID=2636026 RepID=UPI003D7CBD32